MCFVLAWCTRFFTSAIADWLSSKMVVASLLWKPSSLRNVRSQMASFVACVRAIYSASVDDSATVAWHLLLQLTTPPETRKIYPDVERRESRSLPQFASEYPDKMGFLGLSIVVMAPSISLKFLVPFMYRSMRCAVFKWDCRGSAVNWLMIPMAE